MIFDIAGNVPSDQEQLIRSGFALAHDYFARVMGGDIADSVKATITVKIVNTGLGNQEPGGGGAGATAFDENGIRPFFDVGHPQWIQNLDYFGISAEVHILHTVIHEWAHGWQSWLGALDIHNQSLGNALNEGIAEYLACSALVDAGRLTWATVNPFMLNGAYQSRELDGPVRDVENVVWSGHVGYLAIEWLVSEAPSGRLALRTLGEEIGRGATVADAFRTAFNVELADFYVQFEAWRQIILSDVAAGYGNRPTLINIGETTVGASPGADVIAGTPYGDVLAGLTGDDVIWGRAGRDKLYGNEGDDTLAGGSDRDTLDGGLGRDTASYADAAGKITAHLKSPAKNTGDARGDAYFSIENLLGSRFGDTLTGNDVANLLAGGGGKDKISGGRGNDTLAGGTGHDTLTGGSGRDFFLFDTAPRSRDRDTITDFKPRQDVILLDDAVFPALSPGVLPRAMFYANQTGRAHDSSDRLIYEKDTGKLYYDADGTGAAARVLLATLDSRLSLTHADFLIV